MNPDFVDLVNRRAARLNHNIVARHGTFDTFESDDRYAMILFYECFHHALRPWALLERMARHLEPNGRIILAGEPINSTWWKHWGLRLDPLSVYCIHKFGWLESGWSVDFLRASFQRAGLAVQIKDHPEGEIGFIVVGSRTKIGQISAEEVARLWQHVGWIVDSGYMISKGDSNLSVTFPAPSKAISLGLQNFRPTPVRITIGSGGTPLVERDLPPGRSDIEIGIEKVQDNLTLTSETWVPDVEIGNGDNRRMGIHLADVTFF